MRQDTPLGPVWIFPDMLPPKAAMHGARLELQWPDLEGFTALHTGPEKGGAWLVRAPRAALEKMALPTDSATEYPVAENTCWPPLLPTRWVVEYTPGPPAIGVLTKHWVECETSDEAWEIVNGYHRRVMIHKVREWEWKKDSDIREFKTKL